MANSIHATKSVVIAVGECGTCERDIQTRVRKADYDDHVDVRCRECESVTVLRDFEPPGSWGGRDG